MLVLVLKKYTFFQKKKDPAAAGSVFYTIDEISIMIFLYQFYHSNIFLFLSSIFRSTLRAQKQMRITA